MAFTLLQAGATLISINSTGGISPPLTLPAGVTLSTTVVPRFARYKRFVIVVNTPTQPLSVDDGGIVRFLTPKAPASAVILTAPNAGTLTGTYLARQTYRLLDVSGNVISESDYGPAMTLPFTEANKQLIATFPISTQTVDGTELYRTTTLGAILFPWVAVPGNITTQVQDQTADAGLGIVPGPQLGPAPDLTLIAEFEGRLWGVDRGNVDNLRYTEAGTMYAWSVLNVLPIPHIGSDAKGITALIPRRNALGVARLDVFQQVTGDTRDNFRPTVVNGGEAMGCVSQESVVVYNDIAYFLWRDGVYTWTSSGIQSITNGRVRSWFTTDTYFNRSRFENAFAELDPVTLKYRLFLSSPGSFVNDRWIEYDLMTQSWWGPHITGAFTPSCAVLVASQTTNPFFMVGSQEGFLSQDQEDKNDWGVTPIAFSAETIKHGLTIDPEHEKYWGELTVSGKTQTAGLVAVTPIVGDTDNVPDGVPFNYDMSLGRHRLGRIGVGKRVSLRFTHSTLNQDVVLYGYEIDPVTIVGRR